MTAGVSSSVSWISRPRLGRVAALCPDACAGLRSRLSGAVWCALAGQILIGLLEVGWVPAAAGAELLTTAPPAPVRPSLTGTPPAEERQADLPGAPTTAPSILHALERLQQTHPALKSGQAQLEVLRARVLQAGALSDPMVSVGIQNDGFSGLQLGTMENSYVSLMVSQSLSWPWALRRSVEEARIELQLAQAALDRAALDLKRDAVRLFLQQSRLRSGEQLLLEQERLWEQLEALASARYQSGSASLAELLRVRLELSGLQAERLVLRSQQEAVVRALRALFGLELEDTLPSPASIEALADLIAPPLRSLKEALEDARRRSPELSSLVLRRHRQELRLAQAEGWKVPAPSLSAGLMLRGALEPMWQLGVGASLPVWAGQKQLSEVRARLKEREALLYEEQQLLRTLALRVQERVETLQLVQEAQALQLELRVPLAEALVRAAMSEYEAGKGGFAPVLDALSSLLQTRQSTQNLAFLALELSIDAEGVSLEPAPGLSLEGGGGRMQLQPGARSAGSSAPAETSNAPPARAGSSGMGM